MIPAEAIEAAQEAVKDAMIEHGPDGHIDGFEEITRSALEAAEPHMLVHVHHHDIEHHARSFNEGYETAVTQGLADDPTLADDWFQGKLREARAEALEQAAEAWQVRMDTIGRGSVEAKTFMQVRAVAEREAGRG